MQRCSLVCYVSLCICLWHLRSMMDAVLATNCHGGRAICWKHYTVILTIHIKPRVCTLGQLLQKRLPALDQEDPQIPHRIRGKWHHHSDNAFRWGCACAWRHSRTIIPTIEKLWGGSFLFPPDPKLWVILLINLNASMWYWNWLTSWWQWQPKWRQLVSAGNHINIQTKSKHGKQQGCSSF